VCVYVCVCLCVCVYVCVCVSILISTLEGRRGERMEHEDTIVILITIVQRNDYRQSGKKQIGGVVMSEME